MRPAGEISRVMLDAAIKLAQQRSGQAQQGVTQRCVVSAVVPTGVARGAAVWTWKNLVRAGHLKPLAGTVRVPSVCKPLRLYEPAGTALRALDAAGAGANGVDSFSDLTRALRGMCRPP